MSTNAEKQLESIKQVVHLVEPDFNTLAQIHGAVNFKKEASFAMQILSGNNYLLGVALAEKDSLMNAIINVAAVGLSLSPVQRLAYLVPRNKRICLDISYLGYIHLAIECGAIKWAVAEIVYKNDTFKLMGLGKEPLHEFEPFGDRGEPTGAYCVAKTPDGEFLTTRMTLDEIYDIRDRSESYKAYKSKKANSSPWVSDEQEMIRKTVIRRAWKSWPKKGNSQRLDAAVAIADSTDPIIDIVADKQSDPALLEEPIDRIPYALSLLEKVGRTEEKFMTYLVRIFKRDLKTLEDLTETEMDHAISMLESFSTPKKETKNENAG